MEPRVSIVVPTRNRAVDLPGALASVLGQTFTDWECIVVDDGSTDGTPDVVREAARADPRVRSVRRGPGGSPGGARNAGLGVARGRLVAFLDDDDRWLPGKLALQLPLIEADRHAGMIFGRVELFGDAVGVWPRRPPSARPSLRKLLASNFVPTSTVVARRSAVDRAGGFDEGLRVSGDYDLWIRIAIGAPIRGDSAVVARYRFDAARFAAQHAARIEALDLIASTVAGTGAVPPRWLAPARRRVHRYRARHASTWGERLSEWRRALL